MLNSKAIKHVSTFKCLRFHVKTYTKLRECGVCRRTPTLNTVRPTFNALWWAVLLLDIFVAVFHVSFAMMYLSYDVLSLVLLCNAAYLSSQRMLPFAFHVDMTVFFFFFLCPTPAASGGGTYNLYLDSKLTTDTRRKLRGVNSFSLLLARLELGQNKTDRNTENHEEVIRKLYL